MRSQARAVGSAHRWSAAAAQQATVREIQVRVKNAAIVAMYSASHERFAKRNAQAETGTR